MRREFNGLYFSSWRGGSACLKVVCQQHEKREEVIDSFERLMLQGKRV